MKSLKQQHETVCGIALVFSAFLIGLLSGCGNQIGDSASDDDVSTNVVTTITSAETNTEKCSEGMLWKPVSESDGKLAILFDSGFVYEEVCVEDLEGEFDCDDSADFTNGGRATYRFPKEGAEYSGVITADDCEWMVKDPSERTE
jgi:hypothetical protein